MTTKPNRRAKPQETRAWARRLLSDDHWVVLDLETTGLPPRAQPVEVAVVGPRGDLLLDSLIRPTIAVEPGAARLHGLSAERLEAAPSFQAVHANLARVVSGRVVLAYWAAFDRAALESACQNAGLPILSCQWECAYEHYAAWRGFSASLQSACEIEGIPTTVRHRAAPDAHLVWQLVVRMATSRR